MTLLVDGVVADQRGYSTNPGATSVDFFAASRPYAFEPGSATQRTAAVHIYDECTGPGESFTLNSVAVDAIAMR